MLVLIGLGGNDGDVLSAFAGAVAGLGREVPLLARSSVWRSAPLGPPQREYLNAAVLIEASVPPSAVLALCQQLESAAGRDRDLETRWGPRKLDLDLLIVPGLVVESQELVLPHPRLAERRFALAPAAELVPDWVHLRAHRTLGQLAAHPALIAQRCEVTVAPDRWGGESR